MLVKGDSALLLGQEWEEASALLSLLVGVLFQSSPLRILLLCRSGCGGGFCPLGRGTLSHSLLPTGVVLGRDGGAISQMLLPFRLGLGGPLGSGLQPFPWIHIQDLSGIVCHALEKESVQGILNGVAPSSPATSNGTFAQELAAALGRPALVPVPAWAVRAVFGAERAVMLLEGQRVLPKRTLESGYHFIFPDLAGALKDIVA